MCWIGSLGEGHLCSHSGRVIVDCSHMVTYDPKQAQSISPVFQMVACSGIWPDPELY